ncbi:MAG: DUF1385 domain-containing protein [Thermotogaceae bacterium]|nr:DUF1385 domain-containing protein [Thermotogaceae bacterium]
MAKRVGGQAVIEGVLMIGKGAVIAVRNQQKEIVTEEIGKIKSTFWKKIPFVRGIYNLYYSLLFGIKALNRSAEIAYNEEIKKGEGVFTILVAFAVAIGLFFMLPMFLTSLLKALRSNEFMFSLVEGLIRVGIFLLYVWIISLMKDVKRLFQYHGAEHKTINAFESGVDLTPENVKNYSRIHPRCGTNFLMIFMIASVLLFSFLSLFFEPTLRYRIISRVVMIPVIASLSYELLVIFSKFPEWLMKIVISPGLALQYLTTKEPDEKQLEVAIVALKGALKGEGEEADIMA